MTSNFSSLMTGHYSPIPVKVRRMAFEIEPSSLIYLAVFVNIVAKQGISVVYFTITHLVGGIYDYTGCFYRNREALSL